MSGTKHDGGKAPLALIAPSWLFGVAEVLGFGQKKYHAWNWTGGFQWSRLSSAAQRHILAWQSGEDIDPESGLHHLLHASCCLMFAYCHVRHGLGTDDRFKFEVRDE